MAGVIWKVSGNNDLALSLSFQLVNLSRGSHVLTFNRSPERNTTQLKFSRFQRDRKQRAQPNISGLAMVDGIQTDLFNLSNRDNTNYRRTMLHNVISMQS